jgi:hypothetical protein
MAYVQRGKEGTILECLRNGQPLHHIPVLDLHTHVGSSSRLYYVPRSTERYVEPYINRYGVDHMLTFTLSSTSDAAVKNRNAYRWMDEFPTKISVLTALHAAFPGDWIGLLQEGAERGARGIKLLTSYQGVKELDVDFSPAFDFARTRSWIVLNHDWVCEEHLADYAGAYPDVTFVIGHPSLPIDSKKRLMSRFDNIYQSTCAAFVMPGFSLYNTEDLYKMLPLDKILFGSDTLDLDLGTAIGPIAYANIPERAKEMILGENALALAQKIGWDLSFIEQTYA